jgi:hypothetical protein
MLPRTHWFVVVVCRCRCDLWRDQSRVCGHRSQSSGFKEMDVRNFDFDMERRNARGSLDARCLAALDTNVELGTSPSAALRAAAPHGGRSER